MSTGRRTCPDCGLTVRADYLSRHRRHLHLGVPYPRTSCPECGRGMTRWALRRHLEAMHYPDLIAVERAAKGELSLGLNRAEMLAAFEYLNARRYSLREIAERLGVTERTVARWRAGQHKPCGRPAQIAARLGVDKRSVVRLREGREKAS